MASTFSESSHIAIRKDREAVLRLMNSTGRLVVDRLLCSTAAVADLARAVRSQWQPRRNPVAAFSGSWRTV